MRSKNYLVKAANVKNPAVKKNIASVTILEKNVTKAVNVKSV